MSAKPSIPLGDWLTPLDKWVPHFAAEHPSLDQFIGDEEFPFLVVRHPSLRLRMGESSIAAIDKLVAAKKAVLNEIGVIDGLSGQHVSELAALLIDCEEKFEAWGSGHKTDPKRLAAWGDKNPRDWRRHVDILAKRGPGQLRKLRRRFSKIMTPSRVS